MFADIFSQIAVSIKRGSSTALFPKSLTLPAADWVKVPHKKHLYSHPVIFFRCFSHRNAPCHAYSNSNFTAPASLKEEFAGNLQRFFWLVIVRQYLTVHWTDCHANKTMGKECWSRVSRRLWGGVKYDSPKNDCVGGYFLYVPFL